MMHVPRIYQNAALSENTSLALSPEAAQHLVRALRLQTGDEFILFNGQGGEFTAAITAIHKNKTMAFIKQFIAKEKESPLLLHLGQGISRGEKMDLAVQKAVELGTQKITPLITARCSVKLSTERWDKRLAHWRMIAIAACEQCGRNTLPEIAQPQALNDWLIALPDNLKLICQPNAEGPLKNYPALINAVTLLIGPESGFTAQEFKLAKQHAFQPLGLGPRTLRTETAAIAAIAAVQTYWGDMNY